MFPLISHICYQYLRSTFFTLFLVGDWSFKMGEVESNTSIGTFLSLDAAKRLWQNCAMNVVWYKFLGDKVDMKSPRPKTDILFLPLMLHMPSHIIFHIV